MKRIGRIILVAFVAVSLYAAPSEAAFSNSLLVKLSGQSATLPHQFVYKQSTALATLIAANYFAATPQRLAAGDILTIEGSDGNGTYTVVSATTTTSVIKRFGGHDELQAATTWDPSATVDGAGVTSNSITVTGAALGDFCAVASPYDLAGQLVTCYVDAADSAKIRIQNESGTNTDNVSGSFVVRVTKP